MIGVSDNTFITGTFSPMVWGLPVLLFFKNTKAASNKIHMAVAASTVLFAPLFLSQGLREQTKYIVGPMTWNGM